MRGRGWRRPTSRNGQQQVERERERKRERERERLNGAIE